MVFLRIGFENRKIQTLRMKDHLLRRACPIPILYIRAGLFTSSLQRIETKNQIILDYIQTNIQTYPEYTFYSDKMLSTLLITK